MFKLITFLTSIIWTSVLSAAALIAALVAIFAGRPLEAIALAVSALTFATLSRI